jgi:hypothetical protein
LDYEIVILLSADHRFGFPEFSPWQAAKQATTADPKPSTLVTHPHLKDIIMNTTRLIAALAFSFAASGAALAQEATYELPQTSTSTTTRAQVLADLQQARTTGSHRVTEGENHKPAVFVAQRSRADVRAETQAAAASGELAQLNRETNSFDGAVHTAATKSETTRLAATASSR